MTKLTVQDTVINLINVNGNDYICLTDMLRAKDGDFFITDWLRNRNTLEYIGIWENVYNPNFNYGEFAIIKSQAGLNSFKISVKEFVAKTNAISLQAKAGRYGGTNPTLKGNIRDYASINELICLSNMENINAVLIEQGLSQGERLVRLNQIAIHQMNVLESAVSPAFAM
ncbi:MAG: KilA-N domain-containing protein [Bacteroidales bacterium]|uniref:KilA-N domain-containing protein n=1 Tax=Candidatus Limisoma sp. TaxID=3076476 RepID=UPI003FF147E2|nr:KilA-N domain-containing protein [Bacteroidales bacterium]